MTISGRRRRSLVSEDEAEVSDICILTEGRRKFKGSLDLTNFIYLGGQLAASAKDASTILCIAA